MTEPLKSDLEESKDNERGVALLVTLFAITVMTFLAVEIGYNSSVEFAVGASQVDRLKAYYLAKTGVEFSLLRIHLYRIALQRFGAQLGPNKSALDMIWQFPFAWPPMVPEESSSFTKDDLKKTVKESYIDGAFSTSIEGEGGKIDINDLASPSETLKKAVNAELVTMIENRLEGDDDWAVSHRGNTRPQEIVNNIADWIDEDNDSLNGGQEDSYYSGNEPKPPNRPMKTLDELHMVKGITDDIFKIIAPRLTVYGVKGINVNLAAKDVLRSIDKQVTDEIAGFIIERRNDPNQGPFQSLNDFLSFVQQKGVNTQTFNKSPEIPLLFDAEYNFRIKSTGIYRKAQREIVAIVYDFDKVKGQLAAQLAAAASPGASPTGSQPLPGVSPQVSPGASPAGSPGSGAATSDQGTKGRPQIVFWQEF